MKGGNNKINLWLKNYNLYKNQHIIFKLFLKTNKTIIIKKISKKLINNKLLIKKTIINKNKINNKLLIKKKTLFNFYNETEKNLILLKHLKLLNIDIDIDNKKFILIHTDKDEKKLNINNIKIDNIDKFNNIELGTKYDIISIQLNVFKLNVIEYDDYYTLKKNILNIKCLPKILNSLNNDGIIILNYSLSNDDFSKDILILLNNYCNVSLISTYKYKELHWITINLILSNIINKENLIKEVEKVLSFKYETLEDSFIEDNIKSSLVKEYEDITKFIYTRFNKIYKMYDNKIPDDVIKIIKEDNKISILKYDELYNENQIPWIIDIFDKTIKNETKLLDLPFEDLKYINKLIYKNKLTKILCTSLNNGIVAFFITLALKKINIEDNIKNSILITINKNRNEKKEKIIIDNLKKIKTNNYFKLINKNIDIGIQELIKKYGNYSFDLIYINNFTTYDDSLINIYFASLLLKKKGALIIKFGETPVIQKIAKYLDDNYLFIKKKINKNILIYEKLNKKK